MLQPPAGPARTAAPRSDARPRPSHGSRPPVARSPTEAGSGPRGLLRRLRLAAVAASALVLVLNGTAWGLYRDVTSGIVTTDVIMGGSGGGPQDILLVGVDSRTDAQGNPLPQEVLEQLHTGGDNPRVLNSDTIILLHVPEGGAAAVAFSIPRDSYVDIPGYRQDKINAAYPAVQALTAERLVGEGVRDRARIDAEAAKAGRTALIGSVERLTGVTVDHYAEINLLGFYNLTKAVGGVDVCLKNAVDEPLSGARFPAGPLTVSGADALAFVRQRHGLPEGDLSRIRRQQVFLAAVADKVLAGGTLTDPAKLAGLVQVAQQSVVLDTGWDLLAFARQASGIAAGDLEFLTVPTGGTETNGRGSVVLVDPAQVRTFVEERSAAREEAALRTQGGGRRAGAGAPAAAGDRGAALRRARAQRVGGERARRAGAGAAHRPRLRPRHGRQHGRRRDVDDPPPRQRRRGRRGRRAARRVRGGAGRRRAVRAPAGRPGCGRAGDDPGAPGADARGHPGGRAVDHGRRRTVHRLIDDRSEEAT